ncbi:MAG: cation-translocating P-type ATPase [Isosphaeraceae bacterium]|nr:cation-translocating P-type ATPase [Isosphaeraceae bacterium]
MDVTEFDALKAAHAAPAEVVAAAIGADLEHGLSGPRAEELRRRFGPNQLAEVPPVPAWRRFLDQFREPVVLILIVAAILSGALGEWADTVAILAIVLLNGALGFLQEERAGRTLAALRKLSAPMARLRREGALRLLPARELVPGDLIELEAGDSVPADARLIHSHGLRVQEAALTGESTAVDKEAETLAPEDAALGDRRNMVYLGTVVAGGRARAVVVATGMATELGRIAGLLERYEPEPTPLQRRLSELGRVLVTVCLVAVTIIFALQMLRGEPFFESFLLAASLAVASVPEGLPAVVTLALALGLQRLVRRNALIRKLPSVETLGSVTVICSDKTGTLTRNEMTVRELVVGGHHFRITGAGYTPHGQFLRADGTGIDPRTDPDLMRALTIAAWCNNARVNPRADGSWEVIGDPTEGALIIAALKAEIEAADQGHHVLYEIPFDSERRAMSVVIRGPEGATMYTKGAPEVVLGKCIAEWAGGHAVPLTPARREEILHASAELASRALRVLALADRRHDDEGRTIYEEDRLIFAGLIGMIDPPREEAKEAVLRCRRAGIRPIMITGDHPATALAIARELQITDEGGRAITGSELDAMSDADLAAAIGRIAVYARVSAEHKLRIVRAFQARGDVVAMTGDGVNDAPAVKAADIGIAMGLTGTDVTKEASDLVLTDDNFASIVNAVEEGRGIFDNIQKSLYYLLSCNTGEVLFMLFATLAGWPTPLTAIQLLWINLVTDSLPALALGMEPPERDIMRRRPRPPREPLITRRFGLLIVSQGLLIALATAVGFAVARREAGIEHARTVALSIMAYAQLFFSFSCRSRSRTLPELGLFSNPYLFGGITISGLLQLSVVVLPFTRSVFDVTAYPGREWGLVLVLALMPVTIIEITKLLRAAVRAARGRRSAPLA